jgi:hypothetical protein
MIYNNPMNCNKARVSSPVRGITFHVMNRKTGRDQFQISIRINLETPPPRE